MAQDGFMAAPVCRREQKDVKVNPRCRMQLVEASRIMP
jgi:hypothetical protein